MKNEYTIKKDLETIIEGNNLLVPEIAAESGISQRTLNNILEGKVVSYDIMDKLYSYIYDLGYTLNRIKSEILTEANNEKLALFHGAKKQIDVITKDGSRDNCDFGRGFYLGTTYEQASSFVFDVDKSSVYSFLFDTNNLVIKELDCDIEWMLLVCYFRGMINDYAASSLVQTYLKDIENVDLIIAPIADNKMFNVMRQFGEGDITTKQAIHALSKSSLGKQYVLKTEKAISHLTNIERMFISTSERKDIQQIMDIRSKEIDTKLKVAKREFRGEGQYIDELFV